MSPIARLKPRGSGCADTPGVNLPGGTVAGGKSQPDFIQQSPGAVTTLPHRVHRPRMIPPPVTASPLLRALTLGFQGLNVPRTPSLWVLLQTWPITTK